jgi:hypothetical protein
MKKLLMNLFLAYGAAVTMGVTLQAETFQMRAAIPFAFQLSSTTIRAGTYIVEQDAAHVTNLRNKVTGKRYYLQPGAGAEQGKGSPRLVFHRYGDRYFLAEVWSPDHAGTKLQPTKAEKELKLSGVKQQAATILLGSPVAPVAVD